MTRRRPRQEASYWDLATQQVLESHEAPPRVCEWPNCGSEGCYRAPKSPEELRVFRWFCLDHVREYNHSWDYFADLKPEDIEEIRRRDFFWHRPTWPLGARTSALHRHGYRMRDPFDLFGGEAPNGHSHPPSPLDEALATLGLQGEATPAQIKARYKALVKLHHPDANGGSKESQERFIVINQAYIYLVRTMANEA